MNNFHPIVFWGQSKEYILLSVKIINAKNVSINIYDENIDFSGEGEGANGLKNYGFDFQYYLPIMSNASSWKIKENFIEIKLKKQLKDPWPRLTSHPIKLPWLKCDFNNFFFDESDYGSEDSEKNFKEKNMSNDKRFSKPKGIIKSDSLFNDVMKPLNLYLLMYNLFQYAGFLYVFGACLWVIYRHGAEGKSKIYSLIRDQLVTVQIAMFLEILHAWLGWVKSSPVSVLMQVLGRNLVLFCIVLPHENLHKDPQFYWLALVWSCVEIVRYPYYLLLLLKENIAFLTWLRYTIWVPLFPIGFMTEGKLILKAIPLLEESKKFSIYLPNIFNVHFDFVVFLYIYIPLATLGFYTLMMRMYRQRRSKIGPNVKRDWSNYNFLQFLVDTFGKKKSTANKPKSSKAIKAGSSVKADDGKTILHNKSE